MFALLAQEKNSSFSMMCLRSEKSLANLKKEVGTSYTCGSKNPHRLKSLSSQIAIFRGREKYALKGF